MHHGWSLLCPSAPWCSLPLSSARARREEPRPNWWYTRNQGCPRGGLTAPCPEAHEENEARKLAIRRKENATKANLVGKHQHRRFLEQVDSLELVACMQGDSGV